MAQKSNILPKSQSFTEAEAKKVCIPSRMLSHFCKKGVIERISRGIYMGTQADLNIEFQPACIAQLLRVELLQSRLRLA